MKDSKCLTFYCSFEGRGWGWKRCWEGKGKERPGEGRKNEDGGREKTREGENEGKRKGKGTGEGTLWKRKGTHQK